MNERERRPGVVPSPETEKPPLDDEQEQRTPASYARPAPDVPVTGRTFANLQRQGRQIT